MSGEEELRGRILDLANRCYRKNQYTFSGFLNMGEQAQVYAMERELSFVPWTLFGGAEECERRMLRFGALEQLGYEEPFPICCVVARPLSFKFAETLSHRDFLGALMNLGVKRDVLGDILIRDKTGYIFCEQTMAEYVKDHLDRVRHTGISCEVAQDCPKAARPVLSDEVLVVSAARCDAVVAGVYRLSRSQSVELFRTQKVFVNGIQYENHSGMLKDKDIVSVRGFGKFVYAGVLGGTQKGRSRIRIRRYI